MKLCGATTDHWRGEKWVCSIPVDSDGQHSHTHEDGRWGVGAEWPNDNPVPAPPAPPPVPKGRWYPKMPPTLDGEDAARYTNRLTGVYGADQVPYDHQRNRQCSIGWHNQCSDPNGYDCECPCHR